MVQRLLLAMPLAVVLLLVETTPSAAVRVRSHGTLKECVVTWGSFCPVESIGLSLLGTAALVAVAAAVWFAFAKLSDGAAKSGHGGLAAVLGLAARFPLPALALIIGGIVVLFGQ